MAVVACTDTLDCDGVGSRSSIELSDNFYVYGGYAWARNGDLVVDIDARDMQIGLGYRHTVFDNADPTCGGDRRNLDPISGDVEILTLDEPLRTVPGVMTHVFASGTKPVFELQLASGRTVRASGNHPFLTLDGWVQVSDLQVQKPMKVWLPVQKW